MARKRAGTLSLKKRGGRMVYVAQVTVDKPDGTIKREAHNLETADMAVAQQRLMQLVATMCPRSSTRTPAPRRAEVAEVSAEESARLWNHHRIRTLIDECGGLDSFLEELVVARNIGGAA